MANIFKQRYEQAKEAASKANKKAAELRKSAGYNQIARGVAAAGVAATTGGYLDGAITALPGGHFGGGDYKKAPNPLMSKRFLALSVATVATAMLLGQKPEANATFVLAAAAGRALAIDNATYRKKSGALSTEQLTKDIGAAKAAAVIAANGYNT